MTKLKWDESGERLYETGIDRGVLYIPSTPGDYDNGVSWNGLISVDEIFDADASQPTYFDGVKYLDRYNNGDYAATLVAFTYPDEFLEFEGMKALGQGLYVDDQAPKLFGLSYRTRIGNDILGSDYAYKIHLLYNLTADLDDLSYENGDNPSAPLNFTWVISSVPEKAPGYRPTAHVILDSRYLDAEMLASLEDILYGLDAYETVIDGLYPWTGASDILDGGNAGAAGGSILDGNVIVTNPPVNPRLPSLTELIGLVLGWDPKLIVPQTVTGLAELIDGYGDLTLVKVPGFYAALPETRLVPTATDGLYRLT